MLDFCREEEGCSKQLGERDLQMPALKQYAASATCAWSPKQHNGHPLLAAGTVAGAVDGTFSTSSILEVCLVLDRT